MPRIARVAGFEALAGRGTVAGSASAATGKASSAPRGLKTDRRGPLARCRR